MRVLGLILFLASLVIVFFHYNIAILLFGTVLLLFGINYLQSKNNIMFYIYFASGIFFIVGICIKGFQL